MSCDNNELKYLLERIISLLENLPCRFCDEIEKRNEIENNTLEKE